MHKPLIHAIAETIAALQHCDRSGNTEWRHRHAARLSQLAARLPSGSGIDAGTTIDVDASTTDRIVLRTSFRHMTDDGMYDGWTEHRIVVRPSFLGTIDIQISGRNRNDIKDYLSDIFTRTLLEPADLLLTEEA